VVTWEILCHLHVGDSPVPDVDNLPEGVVAEVEGGIGLFELVGEDEVVLFTVVADTSERGLGRITVNEREYGAVNEGQLDEAIVAEIGIRTDLRIDMFRWYR
jgi:hypothetical protein